MIVYHATKTKEKFEAITNTKKLIPGRNVTTKRVEGVHLSLDPFLPWSWALDVIGDDTNEAWVLTIEIPDNTPLKPDPSGDGEHYNGRWVVHDGNLPIRIVSAMYISNVQEWESGEKGYEQKLF